MQIEAARGKIVVQMLVCRHHPKHLTQFLMVIITEFQAGLKGCFRIGKPNKVLRGKSILDHALWCKVFVD